MSNGKPIITEAIENMPQFHGVAFSPYVGPWTGQAPNAKVPLWNSYSQQDIVRMLEVIAAQFNKISTYGMGYDGRWHLPTTPWNQLYSNCHVAGAAAQLNQQRGKVAIQVAQGIYQHTNPAHQQAEIEAAFSAAKEANAVYPNTVTSLVFTNEYLVNPETTNAVNAMIMSNKQRAQDLNIKVGVRSHTFGEIANPHSHFYHELKTLIQNCDFIQCNLYPGMHCPTPTDGVNQVGEAFEQIKTAVADINPQCEVMIGETGWPSQGISFNKTDNNVANLLAYYEGIKKWALEHRVMTYLFEAIDEPWKSNQNGSDNPWQGPNGAEGHYGLWFLNTQGGYTYKRGASSVGLRVALKASNGQYVSADFNQDGKLLANRNEIKEWETFELIQRDGNQIGLRADNGQYVSADFNEGGILIANRNEIKEWETFELINVDNKFALQAANQKYVSADFNQGGILVANRNEIKEWETFLITNTLPRKLVWSDEFDSIDESVWTFEVGGHGWGNSELQYYTNGQNAFIQFDPQAGNNVLVLEARKETPPGSSCWYGACQYSSTRLISKDKKSFQYGRIEAKIKLPQTQGIWPAFWMLGNSFGQVGWPQCGEIDIMEHVGSKPTITSGALHGPGYSGATPFFGTQDLGVSVDADYHIYAIEWNANEIRWFVDNTNFYSVTRAQVEQQGAWVFDQPFWLLLNVAVGGTLPGNPDNSSSFPQRMYVDYIRIYQ